MHANKNIQAVEKKFFKETLPVFRSGDTVRVHARIKEGGGKERIQYIEGVVIRRQGKGVTKTFTLRKMSDGVGVELIYPVNSTNVAHIEVLSHGDVRRSRLFYLRGLTGKSARLKSKDTLTASAADIAAEKVTTAARAAAKAEKAEKAN
jgi:large subunit ribosomal protein L19